MSLAELFTAYNTSAAAVATALAVDVRLFEQVDRGRQGLPRVLAVRVAMFLGTTVGEVEKQAFVLTTRSDDRAFTPIPPDPLAGDTLSGALLAPAVQPIPMPSPPGPSARAWVVTNEAGVRQFTELDRHSMAVIGTVSWTTGDRAHALVKTGDGKLWTISQQNVAGDFWIVRLNPVSRLIELNVANTDTNGPRDMAVEPQTDTLWVSNTLSVRLHKIDQTTGQASAFASLQHMSNNYNGRGITAPGDGFVYALGTFSATEGRLFKIDPNTVSVVQVSTGVSLRACQGIAFDETDFWVTADAAPGKVFRIPRSTMIALEMTTTPNEPEEPDAILSVNNQIFVADLDGADARLLKYAIQTPTQLRLLDSEIGAADALAWGPLFYDGAYLWTGRPGADLVRKYIPENLQDATQFTLVASASVGNPASVYVFP